MDETLHKAIAHLLEDLERTAVVEDLLLIGVDWGAYTPEASDAVQEVGFQGAQWPLVYSDSELVLRRTLCRSPRGRAILVYPNDGRFGVPPDLKARAHGGSMHPLGLRHRLHALTGRGWPPEVDYVEWRSSIVRHLDALVRSADQGRLSLDLTRSDLERILVQSAFGLQVEGNDASQLLALLVSAQRRWTDPPSELERSLLRGQLRLHQVSHAGVLLWAAEEAGRAEALVRTGIMMDAEREAGLSPSWGDLHGLRAFLVNERQLAEQDAFEVVIGLAAEALPKVHPSTRGAIARAAEDTLRDVLPEGAYNRWFPDALKGQIARLAGRLAMRDADAADEIAQLRDHLFIDRQKPALEALEVMGALVVGWQEQRGQDRPLQLSSLKSVSGWAAWYAEHGASLDLSALKLMRCQHQVPALSSSIERLLGGYWRWRDDLNVRFARHYLDVYETALHDRDGGAFGVHRILEWVVRPALQSGKRVLLFVVDGMGYAAFCHLLDQWAQESRPVYSQDRAVESPVPRAALALLPSMTSVSRKGIFLNSLPTDRLDDEETYQQKARTTEIQGLQKACSKSRVQLYHKGNLGDGRSLLNDIQFSDRDLIAVILNAIDDDLRNTTTTVRLPRLEDLAPLESAVRTGLDAGWEVIVTADHGHTWHRDKTLRHGPRVSGGGERFAPVASADGMAEDAVVTQDPQIVRLQEGGTVALLTATGAYWGHVPRRGYHGGAALEEVVVPCAFLTFRSPARVSDHAPAAATAETEPSRDEAYDRAGIVLTLPDGRVTSLELPFSLSPLEARLLQALARVDEASEAELKRAVNTRRIGGPLVSLLERLAAEGLDYIESLGPGPQGARYRFRTELLK